MAAAHEVALGFAWMVSVLSGDSTLTSLAPGGVWRALAPPAATPPYIVLSHQAGSDSVTFGGARATSNMLIQARVAGPSNNTTTLMSAAARMDTLLTQAASLAVTGGTIQACYRFQTLQLDELVGGQQWANVGGLYRVMAKSA